MKKRLILSALFAVCLLATAIFCWPVEAQATIVDSGTCGDNITWTLDDEGTLTISGTGAMDNYKESNMVNELAPWYRDPLRVKNIIIEGGVTTIGDFAFASCNRLTNVTIPDSVLTIGDSAFQACTDLTIVTIPNGVISIGDEAFDYCQGLTSITIPDSVLTIGDNAFSRCSKLTDIQVSESNPAYCIDEKGVLFTKEKTALIKAPVDLSGTYTIPNSVTTICDYSFASCMSLTSVMIPDSVVTIGRCAFYNCQYLTDVELGNGVVNIGVQAFCYCRYLTNVRIPDSVTTIGQGAFSVCVRLTDLTIGRGVTEIGKGAFTATELNVVHYEGTAEEFKNITIAEENETLLNIDITYNQAPCSHSYDDGEVTKEPTCAVTGVKIYTCTLCGSKKTETLEKSTIHNYNTGTVTKEPTCSADGVKVYTCSVCGDEKTEYLTERPEHSYNSGVVTKEATCAETGEKTFTCMNCGASKVEHTPKLTTHHYMNGICLDCGGEDPQYAEPTDEEKAEKVGGLLGAIIRLLQSILKIIFFFL